MRSLQRPTRERFPPREAAPGERDRPQARRTAGLRLAAWGGAALCAGLLATGLWMAFGLRVVADARVEAVSQVALAPARVRVREVRCRVGERVRAGAVLLVLEATRGAAERRSAELAVERAELRLAGLEAGGRIEDVDLLERIDRSLDARREAALAAGEREVREAELEVLERQRAEGLVEEHLAREYRTARQSSFADRRSEVAARAARADSEGDLREFEVKSRSALAAEGLVSQLSLRESQAALEASRSTRAELGASLRAVDLDQQAERAALQHDQQRIQARVEGLDAQLEAARRRAAAAGARELEWQELARARSAFAPRGDAAIPDLRELERELARVELDSARATLAERVEQGGGGELRAAFDGVIESLPVVPGLEVAEGAALVSYYDPASLRVVAYVRPGDARRLSGRALCTLLPEDGGAPLTARIDSAPAALVICPAGLVPEQEYVVDLRLALVLRCDDAAALARSYPNLRFKVSFQRAPDAEGQTVRAGVR